MRSTLAALALSVVTLTAVPASAQVTYTGSSTLGDSLIPAAARAFTARTGVPFGAIDIQGTGKGLEALSRGDAHIAGVSRALTHAEKRQGFHWEIIGYDAVAIFVHPSNPISGLNRAQLKDVYTGAATNWKQVGGPNVPIKLITMRVGSGRAQAMDIQQRVMGGAPYREDRLEGEGHTELSALLAGERYGIAAVSLAYARPGIKALAIEGFEPDATTVRSGAYFLSRPLILVSRAPLTAETKRFLDFIMGPEGQQIVARKFVAVR
jgi:phosphate transport system substrate-binding protein